MHYRFVGILLVALGALVVASAAATAAPRPLLSHVSVCPEPVAAGYARCLSEVLIGAQGQAETEAVPNGYGPIQFQTAYGLPLTPPQSPQPEWVWNGQTIGIVDAFDSPTAESDLNTYSSVYGLPACTTDNGCFQKVNQIGGSNFYPWKNGGWALEISLDVQVAHAICPNCKILLVEAWTNSLTNLLTAEDYATSHATVVSNSWGALSSHGRPVIHTTVTLTDPASRSRCRRVIAASVSTSRQLRST